MANLIVSILSDQPIPNVLFIKQKAGAGDRHVFLTSQKMEKNLKSAILADTLGLRKTAFQTLSIDPNSPRSIIKKLMGFPWGSPDRFIVNITGGTKMMSQSTLLFFAKKGNADVYYWPIGKNMMEKLHPDFRELPITKPYQLDLKTYIRAHGYTFSCTRTLSQPFEKADALFDKVIATGEPERVPEIFNAKTSCPSRKNKNYFMGAWFEEWLYAFLKRGLGLPDTQIGLNLKLKNRQSVRKSEADNEIDVAFVYHNRLFMWECKVHYAKRLSGKTIALPVYKIASVSQNLGLQATSVVAVMAPFGHDGQRHDFIKDLTRLMRVKKVFSMEDMADKKRFLTEIKKLIA